MIYTHLHKKHLDEPMLLICDRDENLTPGIRFGPVIRDIYIVECCTGGYGSIIINDVEFPLKRGDCYFLLPGDTIIHTADTKEPRTGVWCSFDGPQIGKRLARAGITAATPFAPPEAFEEITSQIEQMLKLKDESDHGADLRRTACIYQILGALLKHASVTTDKNIWIQKAIGIMESRYYEELSVARIADEVGLDRSYFSTLFKSQTGTTPHAYLTSLRIQKSCVLMRQRNYNINQAAAAVGLDPQNFARLFKRETGMTPGEFRAQLPHESEIMN